MKISIRDGTSKHYKDICRSCSHLARRVDHEGERRMCTEIWEKPEILKSPVSECSNFEVKYATSLSELRQIAWVLRTGKGGKTIGFCRYTELNEKEKEEIDSMRS